MDPQEQENVALSHPELVNEIVEILKKEHEPAQLERFRMEALGDTDPE
jgi:hypothetical protein